MTWFHWDTRGTKLPFGGMMHDHTQKVERLRALIAEPGMILAPGVTDALTARLAESMGFKAIYLGGYVMGQAWGATEPLMTLTETVDFARIIASSTSLPIIVDANSGFGDVLHTRRTVREFISAGVTAIHIEDQYYPKQARYFEHHKYAIPLDQAVEKIQHALDARQHDDMVIIARTDAREAQGEEGLEEMLRRCRAYAEAGADVIMPYPGSAPTAEEAALVAREIDAPLLYVGSEGKPTHAQLTGPQLESMGWKIAVFNLAGVVSQFRAAKEVYENLRTHGTSNLPLSEATTLRQEIEALSGLPEMYALERSTLKKIG